MVAPSVTRPAATVPAPGAVLSLLKPITWFPPMWAYGCGALSVGAASGARWPYVLAGVLLAGPLVCGTSQAVNDWFDREVDAINEPDRVIPSGRVPGRWGLGIAVAWTALSLAVASLLGPWVLVAAALGLALAWMYSAPPFRLKRNGWIGNAAVGFSYESLPWLTAAAAALGGFPPLEVVLVALLYGLGAHGIMTLNDFKSMEGDRRMGLASLPVQLGARGAAALASGVMAAAQLAVVALLVLWQQPWHAAAVGLLLGAQVACMARLLRDPARFAVWYSAVGVGLYVLGMAVAALALAALGASAAAAGA
ncbi:chlorophyll synthase ChlG [Aquibium sp. A9E412]|uniref:chlorophyll synthase ChlG n=1 Tax=Aquibium sp. A9E412 TaxID=2976767 RepID=UPI0025B07465|nr:chlorophyll synthase ChlG [Aquibium sp. A9E412]MDN2566069.1 chlorophyll synthase ChlG [Aquibium sp. A9E412]